MPDVSIVACPDVAWLMSGFITKSELLEVANQLRVTTDARFEDLRNHIDAKNAENRRDVGEALREIKDHLRSINGRVGKTETGQALLEERIRSAGRKAAGISDEDTSPAVTTGDVKRWALGLGLLVALTQLINLLAGGAIKVARALVGSGQ